jgi:hypothetical protein
MPLAEAVVALGTVLANTPAIEKLKPFIIPRNTLSVLL